MSESIREIRESLNMHQVELAKMTGVSQSHISNIENGRVIPEWSVAREIADVLGCDIEDVLKSCKT